MVGKKSGLIIIMALAALLLLGAFAATIVFLVIDRRGPEYDWGSEGELKLALASDAVSIPFEGSIHFNTTLSNVGDTDVRVYFAFGPHLRVEGVDGSVVGFYGDEAAPPASISDDELTVLKAGESKLFRDTLRCSAWGLEHNGTYRAQAIFICKDYKGITLPVWEGELTSNEITFTVA